MPLPPDVDKKIRDQFNELIAEAERLYFEDLERRQQEYDPTPISVDVEAILSTVGSYVPPYPDDNPRIRQFHELRTRAVTLIATLATKQNQIDKRADEIRVLKLEDVEVLIGILKGLKNVYESGMLESLANQVEASVTADYLTYAEQLLKQGNSGQFEHVPAAVLAGAILEDGLRRLCQRQSPPIPIKTGKSHKKMSTMIDDLKKANLYNELRAKHLRAWVDIRNAAAHGRFADFDRKQVEQMLAGIQQFLTDFL